MEWTGQEEVQGQHSPRGCDRYVQEKDGYAKELEDLIPQMEQLMADKQGLKETLESQEAEVTRLSERCSQLQTHLEREQSAGYEASSHLAK